MLVRFIESYTVQSAHGKTYVKGKTYDLSPAAFRHFINKGVAVEVPSGGASKPETASVAPSETAVRPRGRPRTVTRDDG